MKETFYFSHDYNARNDPKLQRLMKRHGVAGIGAYWCVVEMLYEEGGRMMLSDVKMIAFALHVDRKLVVSLIRDFGLFQTGDGAFWSESVCSRLRMRRESAERRSLAGKKGMKSRWGDRPKESPKDDNNAITMLSDNNNNAITMLSKGDNNVMENDNDALKNDNNVMENDNNVMENDNNVITMLSQGDDASSERKEKKSNQKKSKEENPKESGKEKVQPPASRFVPPSIEEIQSYIDEKGYRMNAERFHAFYESKGWYVGKTKMKNWRAAVSGWALRDRERGKTGKNEKFSDTEWNQ